MKVTRLFGIAAGASLVLGMRVLAQDPPPQVLVQPFRPQVAVVRSDLRNLVVAEEGFFAEHARYAASLDSLHFVPSRGVTVSLLQASERGWSAAAGYAGTQLHCWVYVGSAPPPRPDASEGTPLCEGIPAPPSVAADSLRVMMETMQPMFGNLMGTMYDGFVSALARPETADKLAAFTRNYYEALVRRGFSAEQALRIVSAVGIPAMR